nr:hypothetical protein [Mesorhizobium sp.]
MQRHAAIGLGGQRIAVEGDLDGRAGAVFDGDLFACMDDVGIARRIEQLRIRPPEVIQRHTILLGDPGEIVVRLDLVLDRLAAIDLLGGGRRHPAVLVGDDLGFGPCLRIDDRGRGLARLGIADAVAGPPVAIDGLRRFLAVGRGHDGAFVVLIVVGVDGLVAGMRIDDLDRLHVAIVARRFLGRDLIAGGLQFGDDLLVGEAVFPSDLRDAFPVGEVALDVLRSGPARILGGRQYGFAAIRTGDGGYGQRWPLARRHCFHRSATGQRGPLGNRACPKIVLVPRRNGAGVGIVAAGLLATEPIPDR